MSGWCIYEDESQLSPWGNSWTTITEEDIEALKSGKKLIHDDDEYCTIIEMEKK